MRALELPRSVQATRAVLVAAGLGALEAAWTLGTGSGGPGAGVGLGVVAIALVLAVAAWPRWWWVPALAVAEELVHLVLSGGAVWAIPDRIFNHWSHRLVGFPLLPYLTFPAFTAVGEAVAWWRRLKRG